MEQLQLPFGEKYEKTTQKFEYTYGSSGYDSKTEWLIKGLAPKNSLIALIGESGVGKSFVVQEAACCIESGKDFFGKKVSKGAVIVIAGEGSSGFKRRVKGWEISNEEEVDNLAIIPHSVFATEKESEINLINTIKSVEEDTGQSVKAIFIDTLNRSFQGDENSPTDMGKFIQSWDRIRNYFPELSVFFVHHTGKDVSKGARGHSSFKAALDSELLARKGGQKMSYELSNTKQKDAEEATTQLVQLSVIELDIVCDEGIPLTTLVSASSPTDVKDNEEHKSCQYFDLIKKIGTGCTRKIFRDSVKTELHPDYTRANQAAISKALKRLVDSGSIEIKKSLDSTDDDQIKIVS
ncbi:AAA family ATPase [Vibrio crassostreae]|uniref:AAA family ATPase n=1 Tax=Vibrio crassostreae TaxID=246167 RepID=UPI0002EB9072|nr:AAA family ATPase [Vibrio crassostreae]OED91246.1 hypothetical protein A141_12340 [Vibrio crassostreae ZF-91]